MSEKSNVHNVQEWTRKKNKKSWELHKPQLLTPHQGWFSNIQNYNYCCLHNFSFHQNSVLLDLIGYSSHSKYLIFQEIAIKHLMSNTVVCFLDAKYILLYCKLHAETYFHLFSHLHLLAFWKQTKLEMFFLWARSCLKSLCKLQNGRLSFSTLPILNIISGTFQ